MLERNVRLFSPRHLLESHCFSSQRKIKFCKNMNSLEISLSLLVRNPVQLEKAPPVVEDEVAREVEVEEEGGAAALVVTQKPEIVLGRTRTNRRSGNAGTTRRWQKELLLLRSILTCIRTVQSPKRTVTNLAVTLPLGRTSGTVSSWKMSFSSFSSLICICSIHDIHFPGCLKYNISAMNYDAEVETFPITMADHYGSSSPSPTTTRRRGGNRRRSRAPRSQTPYSDSSEALLPDQLQQLSFLTQQLNDLASGEGGAGAVLQQPLNQSMAPQPQGEGEKNESLKLRLDLNLDVEVTIKAKVHGDVTLSLL